MKGNLDVGGEGRRRRRRRRRDAFWMWEWSGVGWSRGVGGTGRRGIKGESDCP